MDNLKQYIIIFLMLMSYTTIAQCNEGIYIKNDTIIDKSEVILCRNVVMSPSKFAYYYSLEQNFNTLKDSMPSLINKIEKERNSNKEIEENLTSQIKAINAKGKLHLDNYEICEEELINEEIENTILRAESHRYKRKSRVMIVIAFITGILITSL